MKSKDDDLFRLVAVIRRDKFRTILDLLEGETEDLQFSQMTPERMAKWGYADTPRSGPSYKRIRRGVVGNPHDWELRLWPLFKPIFDASLGKDLWIRDERFITVMRNSSHKSTNVSPVFTSFVRAGLIVRTGKGWYSLPDHADKEHGCRPLAA